MKSRERLLGLVTAAGLLILLDALADWAIAIHPWRPHSAEWRFGAAGSFATRLNSYLIAGFLILAPVLVSRSRLRAGIAGALALLSAVLMLAGLIGFVLDGLQIRGNVSAEALRAFDLATIRAGLVVCGAILLVAWVGSTLIRQGRLASDSAPLEPLIVIGAGGSARRRASE